MHWRQFTAPTCVCLIFEMSERKAKISNTELQTRLLRETIEMNEKKRRLEENLKTADVRSKLLIDSAARKDIEAYKNRHGVAEVAHFAMMTADNVNKQI